MYAVAKVASAFELGILHIKNLEPPGTQFVEVTSVQQSTESGGLDLLQISLSLSYSIDPL